MKYRLTPFHFVSLVFLYQAVYYTIDTIRQIHTIELGGFTPFFYFAFLVATLLADLIIQYIVSKTVKSDTKLVLYLVQILVLVIVIVFNIDTVTRG